MPDMDLVISEVDTYVTANSGDTGREVLDGLTIQRKRHQVKQALQRLVDSLDIAVTPVGNGRWYENTFAPV